MTGQLTLDPIRPKAGTMKAAVLDELRIRDGMCRRTAVEWLDCFELSARIGELRALGWEIGTRRCTRHYHNQRFVEYFLA